MKKALLLAATALLSASAAFAQDGVQNAYYIEGNHVMSVDDLTTGVYFLKAHAIGKSDALLYTNPDNWGSIAFKYSTLDINDTGTNNGYVLWQIDVKDNGEGADKTFTIKNVGTDRYWSMIGNTPVTIAEGENAGYYPAKGNIACAIDEFQIAEFKLEAMPESYDYTDKDTKPRFFMHIDNAQFYHLPDNATVPTIAKPYVHCNGSASSFWASYWCDNGTGSSALQFELVQAVTNDDRRVVTVHFPNYNFSPMSFSFPANDDDDVTEDINEIIAEYGGMGKVEMPANTIVSEDNTEMTVGGNWKNSLTPNYVYRINLRPTDTKSAAMRYVREDGADYGLTKTYDTAGAANGDNTFNTIDVERFWYFKEVAPATDDEPAVYTMHTLARPLDEDSKGMFFENINKSHGRLSEVPTELTLSGTTNNGSIIGDFTIKLKGTDTYVHDMDGYLSTWTDANNAPGDMGSIFRISALTDDDFYDFEPYATEEELNAAKDEPTVENILALLANYNGKDLSAAIRAAETYTIGNNVGQYNNPDGNFAELLAAAKAVAADASASDADKVAASNSISEYTLTVNRPQAGHFYRIKSRQTNTVLSSIVTGNRLTMQGIPAGGINDMGACTVFYVHAEPDGTQLLVSFEDGRVIGKFERNNTPTWNMALKGTANASKGVVFGHRGKNSGFVIDVDPDNHRHISNSSDDDNAVNCGDQFSTPYQWDFVEVTWLPIPLFNVDVTSDGGWGSIYSPVELDIAENVYVRGRVTAYTGTINGTKVEKTKLEGTTIPANTPVLLEYHKGGTSDSNGEYVFVPIKYNSVSTQTETSESLKGGDIFATAKEAGKKYYTLHESTTDKFREHDTSLNYVPGFKAHIAVDEANAPEYFQITEPDPSTGISEISPAAAKAVYDLQGRRLAAPAKGINIVNGKKVLVK